MERRGFLSLVGSGLTAITGCIGNNSPRTGTASSTDTQTPTTTTTTRQLEVTLESVQLQYGFVTPASPDSVTVMNTSTQYLIAAVTVEGALAREELTLNIGDEVYESTTEERLYRVMWGSEQWYEQDNSHGLLMFQISQEATGTPRLTWPSGEELLTDKLDIPIGGPPPQFSAFFDLPETYEETEAPPVVINVSNEGEKNGRFLGALNRIGPRIAYTPVGRVSDVVPSGETVDIAVSDSWTGVPDEARIGDDEPDVRYLLDHADGEDSAEIRLI